MSKQKGKAEQRSAKQNDLPFFAFESFNTRLLVLIIIGFLFYGNTLSNEYALDDGIVIEKNMYVQHGIGGIKKIMSTDAYESFYKQMHAEQQLSGGRYRPLSLVTFAIEQSLFGTDKKDKPKNEIAGERHFLNVALYILSVAFLFYFLINFVFKDNPDVAFLAALIFLIHPLHTEVVANVKSRDEILSFLFIVLTFISAFKFVERKSFGQLLLSLLFFFLALLSKEYAISLVVLIPMILYLKTNERLQDILFKCIPLFGVAGVYLLIRFSVVGRGATFENQDVLNNPYIFATDLQKWASKIEVLNHYLRLLFYPYPLSSDYSYSTIPYTDFGNGLVWLSILMHLSMIAATIYLFIKRNILSFAFAFYLIHLFMISNLVMDIGATMGERLVYHSSLGFAICIAMLIVWLVKKMNEANTQKTVLVIIALLVIIPCGYIVVNRNKDWKNDDTLFIKDAETVPNSALVNGNAGKAYIDLAEMPENKTREKELVLKSIYFLDRSVKIHDKYVNGYLNLGVAYFKLKDYDKARQNWDKVREIFPNNPYLKRNYPLLGTAYMNEGLSIGAKDPLRAIKSLEKGVAVDPNNPDIWYNLGGASYTVGDYKRAREAWMRTLVLKPDHEQAKQGLSALVGK